jgi:hypothetical protein
LGKDLTPGPSPVRRGELGLRIPLKKFFLLIVYRILPIIIIKAVRKEIIMKLSEGQKHSIEALSKILSLEALLKIKEGEIKDFEELNLNLFNPDSYHEKIEMHTIIEKEIRERRKKLRKVLHTNC